MTTCTTCGQTITEIVTIDGKPYGTTCAQNKLGIREFPAWFKGGNWDKAKTERQDSDNINAAYFSKCKAITSLFWEEWTTLSKAHLSARRSCNDWAVDFISSIIRQLGYFTVLAEVNHSTMEAAERLWKESSGSFPYLNKEPKRIDELSPKQKAILQKFIL